jgi:hypothetical protein
MKVSVNGLGLTYQWRKNGVNIQNNVVYSGVNKPTLIFTNPNTDFAGNYDVLVKGTCSNNIATSNTALLTIVPGSNNPTGLYINQSEGSHNYSICESNSSYSFAAITEGGANLEYKWYKNGVLIANATSSTYSIPRNRNNVGIYKVEVSTSGGCRTLSASDTINFNFIPRLVNQPTEPQTVYANSGTIVIAPEVADTTGAFFQWYKDSVAIYDDGIISGSITPVLTLYTPSMNYEGNYFLVMQGLCGGAITTVPVRVNIKLFAGVNYPNALQSQCTRTPLTPITPEVMPGSTITGKVSTYSGVFGSGNADGHIINDAKYSALGRIQSDKAGNLYLIDGNAVRKINKSTKQLTTIAGQVNASGYVDGLGSAARFNNPSSLACDTLGNVFIIDKGNNNIRKITASGQVTTFAGGLNSTNTRVDGEAANARFMLLENIAIDNKNNIYVTDFTNHRYDNQYAYNWDGPNYTDKNYLDLIKAINL